MANVHLLMTRARSLGAVLELADDGGVVITKSELFPQSLLVELRQSREEIAAALRDEGEAETALRTWFPLLGSEVLDRETERLGKLWGATRRGLIVDFGPGTPLMTVDPRAVVRDRESAK